MQHPKRSLKPDRTNSIGGSRCGTAAPDVPAAGRTRLETVGGVGGKDQIAVPTGALPPGPRTYCGEYYRSQLSPVPDALAGALLGGPLGTGPSMQPVCADLVQLPPSLRTIRTAATIQKNTDGTAEIADLPGWSAAEIMSSAVLALTADHPELSWLVGTELAGRADCAAAIPSEMLQEMSPGETRLLESCPVTLNAMHCGLTDAGCRQGTVDGTRTTGGDRWKCADTKDLAAIRSAVRQAAAEIGRLDGLDRPRRAAAVHDWVCAHLSYADPRSEPYRRNWRGYQTAWNALADRITVCTGYAKAFKLLCDEYGIPCLIAAGIVHDGPHVWNYVQLQGAWYGVDCTWDDKPSGISHDYFLAGQEFLRSHAEGTYAGYAFSYPKLSSRSFA